MSIPEETNVQTISFVSRSFRAKILHDHSQVFSSNNELETIPLNPMSKIDGPKIQLFTKLFQSSHLSVLPSLPGPAFV